MPNDLHFPGNISEGTEASLQHGTAQMTFSRHPPMVLGGLDTPELFQAWNNWAGTSMDCKMRPVT